VFLAEVRAIATVTQVLMQQKKQTILIRCDSQAAIQAIQATNIGSKTVAECRELLNKLGSKYNVTLSWIKAHASHAGNELADRLAKAGANQVIGPGRFKYYEAAASLSQNLTTKSNQQWQQKWDFNPNKCKQSKFFIQSIKQNITKFNYILKHSNRTIVGRLIQFITGHCNLMYHASKINNFLDPSCRRCQSANETPIHLIRSCPTLTQTRREFFDCQEALCDGFDWNFSQLLKFMQMDSNTWEQMDRQL
jgi:hypothetical protein